MAEQVVSSETCGKMVESATRACQPMISVPPDQSNPNWDAMANSFASLSTAFTFGSILLGILVLLAGYAWGKFIAIEASKEATKAARQRADDYIQQWLANDAPGIIRQRVDFILDATLGPGNDAEAADQIVEEA